MFCATHENLRQLKAEGVRGWGGGDQIPRLVCEQERSLFLLVWQLLLLSACLAITASISTGDMIGGKTAQLLLTCISTGDMIETAAYSR